MIPSVLKRLVLCRRRGVLVGLIEHWLGSQGHILIVKTKTGRHPDFLQTRPLARG